MDQMPKERISDSNDDNIEDGKDNVSSIHVEQNSFKSPKNPINNLNTKERHSVNDFVEDCVEVSKIDKDSVGGNYEDEPQSSTIKQRKKEKLLLLGFEETELEIQKEKIVIEESGKKNPKVKIGFDDINDNIKTNNEENENQSSSSNINSNNLSDKESISRLYLLVFGIIIVIFAILCGIYLYDLKNPTSVQETSPSAKSLLIELNDKLRLKFNNQSKNFFTSILSSYKESIIDSHDPSILMFITNKDSNQLSKCVAINLINLLNDNNNNDILLFDLNDNSNKFLTSDELKLKLDNRLKKIFNEKRNRYAIINNFHLIKPKASLLFYSYGDMHDYASYPGVFIILTYETHDFISDELHEKLSENTRELTRFIESDLIERWNSEINDEQMRPLFTRITNNVILINNQDFCLL